MNDFRGTPRFQVVRRLGAGGMGVVYQAVDREQGIPVALKCLRRFDGEALLHLKREFRSLRDLTHPNLVSLGELVEEAGEWFFTMELVEGENFRRWVRHEASPPSSDDAPSAEAEAASRQTRRVQRTPAAQEAPRLAAWASPHPALFDEERLRRGLGQLAQGLTALHRAGKVHRDIKPSNVLVTPEGRLVLLDFGLASDAGAPPSSGTGRFVLGTPGYMAPEQLTGAGVGPAADWYAVGVVLYGRSSASAPSPAPTRARSPATSTPRSPRAG
jgi:serine/threonine protein kinase